MQGEDRQQLMLLLLPNGEHLVLEICLEPLNRHVHQKAVRVFGEEPSSKPTLTPFRPTKALNIQSWYKRCVKPLFRFSQDQRILTVYGWDVCITKDLEARAEGGADLFARLKHVPRA